MVGLESLVIAFHCHVAAGDGGTDQGGVALHLYIETAVASEKAALVLYAGVIATDAAAGQIEGSAGRGENLTFLLSLFQRDAFPADFFSHRFHHGVGAACCSSSGRNGCVVGPSGRSKSPG
jgi:hypothetical protein